MIILFQNLVKRYMYDALPISEFTKYVLSKIEAPRDVRDSKLDDHSALYFRVPSENFKVSDVKQCVGE